MSFTVRFLPENRTWQGDDVVDLAIAAAGCDILLEQPCGSKLICGKCRVRLRQGELAALPSDTRVLGEVAVAEGWRLGCQLEVDRDVTIEVPPATRSVAAKTFGDDSAFADGFDPVVDAGLLAAAACWGIALDIGSTTLAAALVDLHNGKVVSAAARLNPQVRFGGDVVSRIHHAQENASGNRELHDVLVGALNKLIDTCVGGAAIERDDIHSLAAVGNPTMLHTLLGADVVPLGQAPYLAAWSGPWHGRAHDLGLALPEHTRAYLLPGVRSHVGADTVAAVLATGLDCTPQPRMLLDLGTNSEVVLATADGIVCTSTAAGPAFEGAHIHHGMRGVPGAIDLMRVRGNGSIQTHAIGGADPVGICGSGLIDAVSELLRIGVVEPSGRMRPVGELTAASARLRERLLELDGIGRAVWLAGTRARPVLLTASDVRQLQLVKGSIAAGMRILLDARGLRWSDVDAVLIAGAFGNFVRKTSAQTIGLVPDIDPERVLFVGNAAGAGARLALVSREARARAERIAADADYIELAQHPQYQDAFVTSLTFPRPNVE